jgi:hypothetical protein
LKKEKQIMKTILIKLATVMVMLLLIALSPAWSAETQSMMGSGTTTTPSGGGYTTTTMMGGGMGRTTTIPNGSSNTTTTMMGGGIGGGGMMGGSNRMGQFVIADLDNDNVPEIVTIVGGKELVIMDNVGNVISSKPFPTLPGLTNERITIGDLQAADMDGDGIPEIVTTYYVTGYGFMFGSGTSTNRGNYLVIMDNQGNLKDYKKLELPNVY